jgi:broad specificity phosphatase PhoE
MSAQQPVRTLGAFDVAFLTGVDDVTELILVRHGQQAFPDLRTGPIGSIVDPPLSDVGQRQAELVGKRFASERIDALYASHLSRALDTGIQIGRHHGLEPTVVNDLREVETYRDVPQDRSLIESVGQSMLAGLRDRMIRERKWDVYPFSEGSFEFRKRCVNAIEAVIAHHPAQRIAVACHGGVINAYIGHILGIEVDMWFRPGHTAVNVVLAKDGIRSLRSLNDVHHLSNEDPALVTY